MFSFSSNLTAKPFGNLAALVLILFVSLLFFGCGGGGGGSIDLRTFSEYEVLFYDDKLDLLDTEVVSNSIDLDAKKSEYGVSEWYLAKSTAPIDGNFTPNGNTNFYAIPNVVEISNQAELSNIESNRFGNYILLRDIELKAGEDGFDETYGWTPLFKDYDNAFGGIFNGNHHTISGLWMDEPSRVGAFGLFAGVVGGTIKNLGLLIDDDNGGVKGQCYTGGIAGFLTVNSAIINSYSIGSVNGICSVGGITGELLEGSKIINSYFMGKISGDGDIGGIAGILDKYATITNAYSKATIVGDYELGGIAGAMAVSTITNSYSTGNISGTREIGGIVGYFEGSILANNAAINQEINGTDNNVNRIIGVIQNTGHTTISNNFALDTMQITIKDSNGEAGIDGTDEDFKTQEFYSDTLGWAFDEDDILSPWKIYEGEGYPFLYWEDK
ncbi:MAG: hypothetical protein LBQ18_08050 [Campylobacteraceae bacterium]|nr:hypothetical protein [Campylobacteraceae bacterium]